MELKHLILTRTDSDAEGTSGKITFNDQHIAHTLEPQWFGNQVGRSCIPVGIYTCRLVNSPKFGRAYQVQDVENRSHILFHAGNFAGDVQSNLKADSEGCILLGTTDGKLQGQRAVLGSRVALRYFHRLLDNTDFKLTVRYA